MRKDTFSVVTVSQELPSRNGFLLQTGDWTNATSTRGRNMLTACQVPVVQHGYENSKLPRLRRSSSSKFPHPSCGTN
ncbi:hypothetical protein ECG_04739 [Echinococcus granulosus]|uniref:DUF1989 domain-containing protein n=1 Tax=Echinococcus granulosus TaxID=6210 RepID=A0A068WH05_ECHGR|nr:hypothetical protein ECG_04739 [Echinococcus granulosus]CDS16958.1 hypothetical protein EgrG_000967500 [Echinococcus granulosus]